MDIRIANNKDLELLCDHDKHIDIKEMENIISLKRVYIAELNGVFIGWLRYNLFWDNTPFMNMIYFLDEYRDKGNGKQMVQFWENQMKLLKYKTLMTSTASDEYAQHFYMKLGYQAVGGFMFQSDPYEIILTKNI